MRDSLSPPAAMRGSLGSARPAVSYLYWLMFALFVERSLEAREALGAARIGACA